MSAKKKPQQNPFAMLKLQDSTLSWLTANFYKIVLALAIVLALEILYNVVFSLSGLRVFSPLTLVYFGAYFYGAELLLLLIAIPGLKKQKFSSWLLVLAAVIIAIVGYLLYFNYFGAIITALVGFFFLFQIRSRFNK